MNIGKKILIMGGSCAGKSTTAERLSKKFDIPVLHLDLYDPYVAPEGAEREKRKAKIKKVIIDTIKTDSWVIDGTYEWYSFQERMNAADTLVLLYSPVYKRIWCYIRTCALRIKRHGRAGFSAKNFRMEHVWYMLKRKDASYSLIENTIRQHKKLQVVKLKSYKEIDDFINNAKLNKAR